MLQPLPLLPPGPQSRDPLSSPVQHRNLQCTAWWGKSRGPGVGGHCRRIWFSAISPASHCTHTSRSPLGHEFLSLLEGSVRHWGQEDMGSSASVLGLPRLELVPLSETQRPHALGKDCIFPGLFPPEETLHLKFFQSFSKHLRSPADCWGLDLPPQGLHSGFVCPRRSVFKNLC